MIAVQSNALSLAGLFMVGILPMPDFVQQYARGPEDFITVTTRERYFSESKKKGSIASATLSTTANEYQPFGSMPRDCNSFRRILLIHVARDESPSFRISSSSCERKSSESRIGNCLERFSGIDMVYTSGNILMVYTSVYANEYKGQCPEARQTLTGHLTTTDSESIEEAVMQNITPAQGRHSLTQNSGTDAVSFVWIIAAVRRDCPTVKATIHHIAAATEREARRTMAKDHVCFFAGRIRQGVNHA